MITHQISTVQVFATDQYKNFIMILGNRALNTGKINRIIKQIEAGNDMLQYYPIQVRVVKDKLEILDGQHRFFICKKLKRQVHYILVSEQKSIADIARVNSNVQKWTSIDFINCYQNNNSEDYKILKDFVDKYGFGISTCINLLTCGQPTPNKFKDEMLAFQDGNMKVTEYEKAVAIAEDCMKFSTSPACRDRNFIIALNQIRIANLITVDTLVAAFRKRPDMLVKQISTKKYIYALEEIANIGKQKRIHIV